MTKSVSLEIAVQSAAGARVAFQEGADRVELCTALSVGGLTPSAGTVDAVVEAAGTGERVAVLVRPRPGGFVYDADDVALVSADIRDAVRRGAGGVVIGALTPEGQADTEALRRWIDAAGGAEVVFHRAIDVAPQPRAVMAALVRLGVTRVLSSGGAVRSIDGLAVLSDLVRESAGRMQVMPGGGVRAQDIASLLAVGVDAVHLSARRDSGDEWPSGPGGGAVGFDVTDRALVAAARAAVDAAAAAGL